MNLLVCERCGERTDHPRVEADAVIRCDHCGHRWPFRRLALRCVTGPSGTGKSAVTRHLVDSLADRFVVLEQDVLWQAGLRDDDGDHRAFRSAWLRMAAMIHQNGRPVVLVGTVVPQEFEPLPERPLFERIDYLCLTCDPAVLAERLRARPAWRQWDEPRIAEMLEYAEWIRDDAALFEPPMTLLDTTRAPVDETVRAVREWVLNRRP
ncbi:AAA family ATPase [Jiangella asiatica]|uniref:Nucleoside kinase n=1 Tax=Jiangella asiatica TaxID=2530372 RepID=A0A4R5CRL3_9ACTN|nr:AAA family ATPase [Jiangella asiatica]TDE02010.1 hypothetical protein E1269_22470 [Jiangella asiatica]